MPDTPTQASEAEAPVFGLRSTVCDEAKLRAAREDIVPETPTQDSEDDTMDCREEEEEVEQTAASEKAGRTG